MDDFDGKDPIRSTNERIRKYVFGRGTEEDRISMDNMLTNYLRIVLHENSLAMRMCWKKDAPDSERTVVSMDDDISWAGDDPFVACFSEDFRVLVSRIAPEDRIPDMRRFVIGDRSVRSIARGFFDTKMIERVNKRVFDTDGAGMPNNRSGAVQWVDSREKPTMAGLMPIVPMDESVGMILVNEFTARDLLSDLHATGSEDGKPDDLATCPFCLDSLPGKPYVKFIVHIGNELVPDGWAYFVPSGSLQVEWLQMPSVYTKVDGPYFHWFAHCAFRWADDEDKCVGIKLVRFNQA